MGVHVADERSDLVCFAGAMPLLRRKPFTPIKPPENLTSEDEVFFNELTGEVFTDYE